MQEKDNTAVAMTSSRFVNIYQMSTEVSGHIWMFNKYKLLHLYFYYWIN